MPVLTPWLEETPDIIRYDAVSVLLESGGKAGREVLRKYRDSGRVQEPRLAAMLENLNQPKPGK